MKVMIQINKRNLKNKCGTIVMIQINKRSLKDKSVTIVMIKVNKLNRGGQGSNESEYNYFNFEINNFYILIIYHNILIPNHGCIFNEIENYYNY